jgi:hypothetical protein
VIARFPSFRFSLFPKVIIVLFVGMGVLAGPGQAGTAWAHGIVSYGEVTRWGGYAVPQLPSKPELGKFVFPVGFAVVPKEANGEENDVYVLDRVLNEEVFGGESKLGYRLQKLSSTGTPLGSVTLPPEASFGEDNEDARPMVSLAVDPAKGRVYALVEGIVESGREQHVPVVQRLVAWSTTPNASKELEPANGFPVDPVTHAGLIAGPVTLEPVEVSEDLYSPQGLVIASNGDVVIEAQHGVSGLEGGPTVLQRVSTTEHSSGEGNLDGGPWNAKAEPGIALANQQADGLFTTNDGSFGIDLYEKQGSISRLAEVGSSETGFTQAKLIAPDPSGNVNQDEAPTLDGQYTVNYHRADNAEFIRFPYTAGSPVVQLSNDLYAARYAYIEHTLDFQTAIAPWASAGSELESFWTELSRATGVGNAGIRLFRYEDEKYEPATMIGGQPSGACSLDNFALSVAAGANERLFVLTQPNVQNGRVGEDNDEVIEFAPGGAGACPKPVGAVSVKEGGVEHQIVGGEVTVHQGLPVTFDAVSSERAGETPYEFDWDLEGATSGGTAGTNDGFDLGAKIEEPSYLWPNPEVVEHIFETPGEYKASMRMIGDYGTTVFPFTIKVLGTEAPIAAFSCPEPIVAGQAVTCDASLSKPTGGSKISSYHWEFSDGGKPVTNEPHDSHTFATPGKYKVKLTVEDEESKQTSVPVEHEVTVETAPATKCTTNCNPNPNPSPGPSPGPSPSPGPGLISPPPPAHTGSVTPPARKPLTTAQKLALALKACKKQPKKHRASCIKQAEKKYAPKKKNKTKKK